MLRGWKMAWKPRGDGSARGDLLERVSAARGVTPDELEPSLMQLHDPGLLPGIDRACGRLLDAARVGERIVIYGDYDVDGITASAILYRMLKALHPAADVVTYVPHRVDEGYGLNAAAMTALASDGARVVISVDCGITAAEPARVAGRAGLDLIITDHHNPPRTGDALPDAFAIVHPRLPGSTYPFGELCGAGVALKIAWRLATMHEGSERVSPGVRALLLDLLALAALGTVADVVPLIDENRAIVRFGLARCRSTAVTGLTALIEAAGLSGDRINAEKVGFRLGPMLNAVGRLGHAAEAVELLITEDRARAAEIAGGLQRINEQRKQKQRRIFEQASAMAEAAGMTGDDTRAIVLAHEDWHPGVVGIVCSRLVETYARPTILMQKQCGAHGTVCVGSGRSIDGFDLHGAVASCADCLTGFGGHDMAIGLRLDGAKLEAFTARFLARAGDELEPADLIQTARYDCEASLAELTPAAVRRLEKLAPFGRSNPPVRLLLPMLRVDGQPRPFGRTGDHLGLHLRGPDGGVVRAIGWRWAEMFDRLRPGTLLDVLVEPAVSDYSGRVEPVLIDARGAGQAAEGPACGATTASAAGDMLGACAPRTPA